MQKMLPENRTFISSHQYNSRPSGAGMHGNRESSQPAARHIPTRSLNVQPRAIANPFHAIHRGLTKRGIYDRLHPRNMYRAVVPILRPERPAPEVKVDIPHSHHD